MNAYGCNVMFNRKNEGFALLNHVGNYIDCIVV